MVQYSVQYVHIHIGDCNSICKLIMLKKLKLQTVECFEIKLHELNKPSFVIWKTQRGRVCIKGICVFTNSLQ